MKGRRSQEELGYREGNKVRMIGDGCLGEKEGVSV